MAAMFRLRRVVMRFSKRSGLAPLANSSSQNSTRIGSLPLDQDGSGNEVWIRDPAVAQQQAFLISASDGLYLVDISEDRSTMINGRPIAFCVKIRLQPGDRITVGRQNLEVVLKL